MRFVIAVDAEGLACVVGAPGMTLTKSRNYAFACQQAVREVNAGVRALFEMGAEEVIVWDNHGGGVNLPYEELDERVLIALRAGFEHRFPAMDDTCAGVLLIGYHAMDGTSDAVLAHTYSSKAYQGVEVNGESVGEIALDAAVAGERNVPVIFVSGDDRCVAEARRFLPWVETVETKRAYGWNAAVSKHPCRVEREIAEGVKRAVSRLSEMQVFRFASPMTVRLRYKRLDEAERASRAARAGSASTPTPPKPCWSESPVAMREESTNPASDCRYCHAERQSYCHAERSEASRRSTMGILRFDQNDKIEAQNDSKKNQLRRTGETRLRRTIR